jgi:hypothetical protein
MIVLRIFRKLGRTAQVCNSRITRKRNTEVITNIDIYIYILHRPGNGDFKEGIYMSIPIDKEATRKI